MHLQSARREALGAGDAAGYPASRRLAAGDQCSMISRMYRFFSLPLAAAMMVRIADA